LPFLLASRQSVAALDVLAGERIAQL